MPLRKNRLMQTKREAAENTYCFSSVSTCDIAVSLRSDVTLHARSGQYVVERVRLTHTAARLAG